MKGYGNMFDVEKPHAECYYSDCEFIDKFQIMGKQGESYEAFKCTLSIDDRLYKCPLYCKDLESLSIPNYVLLYRELLTKHKKLSKMIDDMNDANDKAHQQINYLENQLKTRNNEIDDYKRKFEKHERFFNRVEDDCKTLINLHHDRDELRNYLIDLRNMVKFRDEWL